MLKVIKNITAVKFRGIMLNLPSVAMVYSTVGGSLGPISSLRKAQMEE